MVLFPPAVTLYKLHKGVYSGSEAFVTTWKLPQAGFFRQSCWQIGGSIEDPEYMLLAA
jgi:hypothetical protein